MYCTYYKLYSNFTIFLTDSSMSLTIAKLLMHLKISLNLVRDSEICIFISKLAHVESIAQSTSGINYRKHFMTFCNILCHVL